MGGEFILGQGEVAFHPASDVFCLWDLGRPLSKAFLLAEGLSILGVLLFDEITGLDQKEKNSMLARGPLGQVNHSQVMSHEPNG